MAVADRIAAPLVTVDVPIKLTADPTDAIVVWLTVMADVPMKLTAVPLLDITPAPTTSELVAV